MSYLVSFCSCVFFSVLLALRLPRLGKRELILVLFERLLDLGLFSFVGFLFLLVYGKGCGLWLWHSPDFSLTFFFPYNLNTVQRSVKHQIIIVIIIIIFFFIIIIIIILTEFVGQMQTVYICQQTNKYAYQSKYLSVSILSVPVSVRHFHNLWTWAVEELENDLVV